MPMESDSNLTELLIPVDSGWMEHTKGVAKEIGVIQHDLSSQRRPPPVSELFKLRRPPEMDEPSESAEQTPPAYHSLPSSSTPTDWSSAVALSPVPFPAPDSTEHSVPSFSTLSSSLQDKPVEYTSMEIERPLHSPNTPLSPDNSRPVTSPCLGTEVEEVYAQYPDPSYAQGLEVNTKNIIISEPNRLY